MLSPDFGPPGRAPALPLVDPAGAPPAVKEVFADICSFYATEQPPAVFRWTPTSGRSSAWACRRTA